MERILTELTMLLVRLTYGVHRKKNPTHTLLFIKGTGKDHPSFLVYSQSESWTKELNDLCTK